REGFKAGALNHAASMISGEYVLLLDADSIAPAEVLLDGFAVFEARPSVAFVAYRIAHYNRNQNLITRLFAISQDTYDKIGRIGSCGIDVPFPFWGGCALISVEDLRKVGFWSNDILTDD